MTSKISLNKYIKLVCSQKKWLIALSTILYLGAGPTYLLMFCSYFNNNHYYSKQLNRPKLLADLLFNHIKDRISVFFALVTIFGGVVTALAIYRYIFSKNSVDYYHQTAITRKRLFLGNYLSGMLIWTLPGVISCILTFSIIYLKVRGIYAFGTIALMGLQLLLFMLIWFVMTFNVGILGCMLSGNLLNMVCNTLFLGFFYGIVWIVINTFTADMFSTFWKYSLDPMSFSFLSPLSWPLLHCSYMVNGNVIPCLTILGNVAATAFTFILSLYLYNRRPSELAESGTSHKIYKTISKISLGTVAGLVVGHVIHTLVHDKILWSAFALTIAIILCIGLMNIIFESSHRFFFKQPVIFPVTVVLSLFILICFNKDLFGYDNYVAKNIDKVVIVTSTLSDDSSYMEISPDGKLRYTPVSDDVMIKKGVTITDPGIIDGLVHKKTVIKNDEQYPSYYVTMRLAIHTKSGRTYYREYNYTRDQHEFITTLAKQPGYMKRFYAFSTGQCPMPQQITLYDTFNNSDHITDTSLLFEAYAQDFQENFDSNDTPFFSCAFLDLEYKYDRDDYYYPTVTLPIGRNFTRTIAYLQKELPQREYGFNMVNITEFTPEFPEFTYDDLMDYINTYGLGNVGFVDGWLDGYAMDDYVYVGTVRMYTDVYDSVPCEKGIYIKDTGFFEGKQFYEDLKTSIYY
ncbi:MAG: hypothetical protein K6F84_03195 [Lachnospiraceae bacterium]|nr:hypothetical protein [Lachnospiraceae bacterium]